MLNIKTIFEPIDRLIVQAKGYIKEQDIRKKYVKQIEDKTVIIRPELEKRRDEVLDLLDKIESDDSFKEKLNISLKQINDYLENIELIAEKELALELIPQEKEDSIKDRSAHRIKYINHQITRLEEQLKITTNFFEVADFANEIWADFDLFEEFTKDEIVVQLLVDRMNETNTKNTETRIGKDLKKTLEHIRLNLVKSTSWTDDEILSYQKERDAKIKQLLPINIPDDRAYHVYIFGCIAEIIDEINDVYAIPSRLRLEWVDVDDEEAVNQQLRNGKSDLAVIFSIFPNHKKFEDIKDKITQQSIPYVHVLSYSITKLIKTMEEELIRVSFQEHFSKKSS